MTTEQKDGTGQNTTKRRVRGPSKPYPVKPLETVLDLPRSIIEHGVQGEIQRLTLLDKMGISPTSSKTRDLITSSARYGLTVGSYSASSLRVTDDGKAILNSQTHPAALLQTKFRIAIDQFSPFKAVYEKLSGNKLPDTTVIGDILVQAGVGEGDRGSAAKIFEANLRYVGLVKDVSGSDYVATLDDVPEGQSSQDPGQLAPGTDSQQSSPAPMAPPKVKSADPTVHLDIQIHIDSTASSDQIDKIFASMAKHLYGKDG